MPYIIEPNANGFTYKVVHDSGSPSYAVCPCCDKPMVSRKTAETLARNLQILDDAVDNANKELRSC